uniref:Pancreatic trypsin inhibitor n=1 Tax=Rhipicephalus appendiculatus TaxID=34631 RepID=A0A131YS43_RHIAP
MRKYTIFAVVALAMALLSVCKGASKQDDIECDRNKTCMYPDACTECPEPKRELWFRTTFAYYNHETENCEVGIGKTPQSTCNMFPNISYCMFFCGLESDEN